MPVKFLNGVKRVNLRKHHKHLCFFFPIGFQKQRNYGEAEVTIQFLLDGYETTETSETQVVDPPFIQTRKKPEPFVPYPPCSDEFIHIKVFGYIIILLIFDRLEDILQKSLTTSSACRREVMKRIEYIFREKTF